MEVQILQPSVPLEIEFFGLETNDNYANNQLVKEEDIQLSTFQYDFNIHVSITNSGLTSKSYDFVADVYIDGVPDGFITIWNSRLSRGNFL